MARDRDSYSSFARRYALPGTAAGDIIERRAIGANVGANGYTTIVQARSLIRILGLRPGVRLLDVGAGRGWPGLWLAEQSGCNATLVDLPLAALLAALSRRDARDLAHHTTVVRGSATALPFRSRSFDAAVHTDTL